MKPLQQLLETAPLIVISRPLGPPVSNFQQRKRNNDERYSSPVYTHHQGYKICLCVYGNGLDRGKGTHVSVYVFWKVWWFFVNGRFVGVISYQLMDQINGEDHNTYTLSYDDKVPNASCDRERERERDQ